MGQLIEETKTEENSKEIKETVCLNDFKCRMSARIDAYKKINTKNIQNQFNSIKSNEQTRA